MNVGEYNPDRATIRILIHPDLGSHLVSICRTPCVCRDAVERCVEMCQTAAIMFVDEQDVPAMLKKAGWIAAPVFE
jgi:hypothetical protein